MVDVPRTTLDELETDLTRERLTPGSKIKICSFDAYKQPIYLAVDIDGKIVGGATLEVSTSESFELHKLYVHPDFRGQGVGAFLADQACIFAKRNGSIELDIEMSGDSDNFWKRWWQDKQVERFPERKFSVALE